ncbi:lipase member H-A-like isoform X3 [Pieris rapae]|uniref:lipase member H-A-like isoform X3 n=1 Tax=Pieris rapae TaxID=64459 RepID=UPI001E27EDFE|nr:lipase member H-A-like isoform X3 [Pieris rapae]
MKIFPGISLIMKVFVVFAGFIAICAGTTFSPVPGNNSHYVEGVSRYIWMPDGKGVPHLVDLHEPVDEDFFNSRNGNDNQYWLFTRQNRNSRQILQNGNANSIRNSNYRGNRPTKVIVHGWRNNGNTHMNPMITEAFLAVMDCNVIVVDWNRLASQGYNTAARGVPDVGNHLGRFIQFLFNTAGGNWNDLHLVGFSLGAHIVGNAGRQIGGRARRVTGLDPAGPTWGRNSLALNRNSGRYVEAIHTDGRILGIMDSIAHADFYPNGGRNPQPGCGSSTCSHGRATEFFAATVHRSHLVGRLCSSIADAERSNCNGRQLHMGNANLGKQGTGLFGLRTGANWPF